MEEQLPEGSTREQALAWFVSHGLTKYGVDYGDVVTSDGRRCGLWGRKPLPGLENAWIEIYVYFDDNDKVRKRSVARGFYSL